MIACVDVDYRNDHSIAACVLFEGWEDAEAALTRLARIDKVEAYVPGQFYKRELPCLLEVLGSLTQPLDVVIVDGYVWLGEGRQGLGAYLYEALDRKVGVIGVAKTHFNGAPAEEVLRGVASRPLYVTAEGLDVVDAAAHVRSMHGEFRLPTLLKLVDRLCREGS